MTYSEGTIVAAAITGIAYARSTHVTKRGTTDVVEQLSRMERKTTDLAVTLVEHTVNDAENFEHLRAEVRKILPRKRTHLGFRMLATCVSFFLNR